MCSESPGSSSVMVPDVVCRCKGFAFTAMQSHLGSHRHAHSLRSPDPAQSRRDNSPAQVIPEPDPNVSTARRRRSVRNGRIILGGRVLRSCGPRRGAALPRQCRRTAAGNPHRSHEERRWRDELGVDAYQLEELSVIHEVQRRAREVACAAGASDVRALVRSGSPHVVLARESRDLDAAAMVLGYASGPGRLARRLCATTDIPILMVNKGVDAGYLLTATPRGVRNLRERRRAGAPRLRSDDRGLSARAAPDER